MLNQIQLIGHLGRDPEVRQGANGTPVALLSLATSEHWTDDRGNRCEATEWHRVVLFRRLAEVAGEYLRKGSLVYVCGRIQSRQYTDNAGIERYMTEVVGDTMKMLGRAKDAQGTAASGRNAGGPQNGAPDEEADLDVPF